MKTRLFVGNLSRSTTEEDLNTLFKQAGSISSVELLSVGEADHLKCFAFIEMDERGDAEKAIQQFNGSYLNRRPIKVNLARPREARPQDGGWYSDARPSAGNAPRKSTPRRKSA